jgi:glycerol kinase
MYILTIDQGTTGTTTAIFDKNANLVKQAYRQFKQIYPQPGWVEHDPLEIWQTVIDTINELLAGFSGEISAVGITNQRETTLLWDKKSGKPIYNAIVWQCRRTASYCEELREYEDQIRKKTGLPSDPYFSATKIKWLLENVSGYDRENVIFGTIDSWLIWKLTKGKIHATDYTNASRTLLYNIKEKKWDDELLKLLRIPAAILPEVKKSADDFGEVQTIPCITGVPIGGVAGDQQAALFGQKCFKKGQAKNTYGTGCFLVMNSGCEPVYSKHGLITTLAVDEKCEPCYALEGSIFIAGAAIQWLRDELKVIKESAESEAAALSVKDNGGVYFVPAFVGLGAPHWDSAARGTIVGITRGTGRNHIIRAALESMAYQTFDVLSIMEKEAQIAIDNLAVDGGATANNFLMQFLADILDIPIIKPDMAEMTSLGAAYLAGLQSGLWRNTNEIYQIKREQTQFVPQRKDPLRQQLLAGWHKAIRQTRLT